MVKYPSKDIVHSLWIFLQLKSIYFLKLARLIIIFKNNSCVRQASIRNSLWRRITCFQYYYSDTGKLFFYSGKRQGDLLFDLCCQIKQCLRICSCGSLFGMSLFFCLLPPSHYYSYCGPLDTTNYPVM